MNQPHHFRLFDLALQSEIDLPELRPEERTDAPDVRIELGSIPSSYDPSKEFEVNNMGACLSIAGVARYWISGGDRILVDPEADVPPCNVRLFLLGSAMGALLHQRGHLPLHANAVEIDGKTYVFMGQSGSGKSTLAAAFHDRGFKVIADDVCVIRFDENGMAFACQGIPRLRLWEDSLAATGRGKAGFERSYSGDDDYKKYDVPIFAEQGSESLPIASIYLLGRGATFVISALHGADAVGSIFANTYRGRLVRSIGNSQAHWAACLRLVREVPIFKLERPWGYDLLSDQIAGLLAHARTSNVRLR